MFPCLLLLYIASKNITMKLQNLFQLFTLASVMGLTGCSQPAQSLSPASETAQPADTVKAQDTAATASAAPEPGTENQTALGIDVSHFQQNVNWDEIKKAGISYAYSKATQGTGDVDPKYHRNRAGTIAAGLYHGAYHFYMAAEDPVRQAEVFIKAVV